MIRVTVELIPWGVGEPKQIGLMHIANDGSGSRDRGNYTASVFRKGWGKVLRRGEVKDYPRLNYNVWRLVMRCLKSSFPEEK
jgi:hypothetical protein